MNEEVVSIGADETTQKPDSGKWIEKVVLKFLNRILLGTKKAQRGVVR